MAGLTLDWLQLAAVAGALQGLVLAGVLVTQKSNRTANRLLAILMVTFTIFLASGVYYSSGLIRAYPHFFGVAYQTPYVFGPLVYLYARAASDREWRIGWRDAGHFVPVLVSTLVMAPYYAMSGSDKIALWERIRGSGLPGLIGVVDPFKYVSGIVYSAATILYVHRHRLRVENSYANTDRVNLRWLQWLVAAAAAIWLFAVALKLGGFPGPLRDAHLSLAMAIFIYGTGYAGLRQPEIFRYDAVVPQASPSPQAPTVEPPSPRYDRSGLADGEAERLEKSLVRMMDAESPWKESELTLADLAARLETTPHKLSEVLNSRVGETFYDFVNGYRVRDVQRRITAGEARTRKMLALAFDAGFASKSTFNQVFKKHASQTPSEFRETVGR
jgi:AraC-like DNA-binding protein